MDKEQLLQKYKIMGFNDLQMIQIESAIEAGLPEKQIDILAKFKYEANKMKEIRLLLERNLNAKLNLSQQQLEELTQNKSSEIILTRLMYEGKIKKRHKNKILTMFEESQLDEINKGLENGLTLDQVKLYANPKFSQGQMEEIRKGLEGNLTKDDVKIYSNPKFDWEQMQEIRLLLEYNKTAEIKLTKKQIQFITNPDLSSVEMQIRRLCYENNISQNETQKLLKMFNDGNCNIDNISYILTNKINIDKIYSVFDKFDGIIDYYFKDYFKQSVIYCCEEFLKYEEAIRALKNLLDIEDENQQKAIKIVDNLRKGMSPKVLLRNNFNHCLALQGHLYEYQREIIELATKNKFTEEEIDKLAFLDYTFRTIYIKNLLKSNLKTNEPLTPKELLTYIFDKSDNEIRLTKLILEGKITNEDKAKILDLKLDATGEIYQGLNNGLSLDEVKIYAKPEFNQGQMMQIRLLLEYNKTAERKLTEEQIKFIANPNLKDYEMKLISVCYKREIATYEINNLLNEKLSENELFEVTYGLELGLSLYDVKTYINPRYNAHMMEQERIKLQKEKWEEIKREEELEKEQEQDELFKEAINSNTKINTELTNDEIEQSLDDLINANPPEKTKGNPTIEEQTKGDKLGGR